MNQAVQCARALREVRIVRIFGPNPIQDEIEAVGVIGHACPQPVEVEAVLDVGPFDLAKHLVALEPAEPVMGTYKKLQLGEI